MKTRSRAFYAYLSETGMLNGTPEQIAIARQEYRKRYKKAWRQGRNTAKEIRFTVTPTQYATIEAKANIIQSRPTAYAKATVLERIGQPAIHNERLLAILQLVSMAATALHHDNPRHRAYGLVRGAEMKLLEYLNVQP